MTAQGGRNWRQRKAYVLAMAGDAVACRVIEPGEGTPEDVKQMNEVRLKIAERLWERSRRLIAGKVPS